ncbi:MAG: UvrD-helicase domain-containing protein, partial [Pseudolabrys sp.]|nr:UvrD-helicase domain-containing protein [Pseudolabrys sp.]
MSAPRQIPPNVRALQVRAADPSHSVFVSANAGSGKTHVLTQRVINLLLGGVDPAKILCITFTKAAAANMATRVFQRLAGWTTLKDAALDAEIEQSTGRAPDAATRALARRLFASALDTPGGLKVQTIHAFCTRLLHQFPFEADVAARFSVLDDASTSQLLERLTLEVLLEASAAPESPLGKALAVAIVSAADQTFKEMINEAIFQRDAMEAWIARAGGLRQAVAELSQQLGVDPDETVEALERQITEGPHLPSSEWESIAKLCAESSASDKTQCKRLRDAAAAKGAARVKNFLSIFFTGDGSLRKTVITGALAKKHPDLAQRFADEAQRVSALRNRLTAATARDRTAALLTIATEVIGRYRKEKNRKALLDYNDLIDKTLALFRKTSAAWVRYKLDLGIDHMLIDEAQDTSPKQWEIIKTIASEFVPGSSRQFTHRTIFAVGDEKQ